MAGLTVSESSSHQSFLWFGILILVVLQAKTNYPLSTRQTHNHKEVIQKQFRTPHFLFHLTSVCETTHQCIPLVCTLSFYGVIFPFAGCVSSEFEHYYNGESWDENNSCTKCKCVDGRRHCTAEACARNCLNPRKVDGQCCPVCDEDDSK